MNPVVTKRHCRFPAPSFAACTLLMFLAQFACSSPPHDGGGVGGTSAVGAAADSGSEGGDTEAAPTSAGPGAPCRFDTDCPGYNGPGVSPLACNTPTATCCIQPAANIACSVDSDCCGSSACMNNLCCQAKGAWCLDDGMCCSGSCNSWTDNCN